MTTKHKAEVLADLADKVLDYEFYEYIPEITHLLRTIPALEAEIERLNAKLEKTDALIDQAYCNGAAAGFNCDTHEDLAKIKRSRDGYLKEILE